MLLLFLLPYQIRIRSTMDENPNLPKPFSPLRHLLRSSESTVHDVRRAQETSRRASEERVPHLRVSYRAPCARQEPYLTIHLTAVVPPYFLMVRLEFYVGIVSRY